MQNKDYYKTLGVSKSATNDEIKKAFRKLAHEYHPDKKTGNEAKFKEVNEAYAVLSDDKKRAQYDQFGSNFQGFQGAGQGAGGFDFSGFANGQGFDFSQFQQGFQGAGFNIDLDDILGSFFGGGSGRSYRFSKGADIRVDIEITFDESITGVTKNININRKGKGDEKININIPAGIENGEMLRFRGKGEAPKDKNGTSGDLFIRIHVKPHKILRKEGIHLVMEKNIKLSEAIAGGEFEIEIIRKKISIKIPQGINNGEMLRVRGKGVLLENGMAGDLLIKINVKMPDRLSGKIKEVVEILKKEGL